MPDPYAIGICSPVNVGYAKRTSQSLARLSPLARELPPNLENNIFANAYISRTQLGSGGGSGLRNTASQTENMRREAGVYTAVFSAFCVKRRQART